MDPDTALRPKCNYTSTMQRNMPERRSQEMGLEMGLEKGFNRVCNFEGGSVSAVRWQE